MQNLYRNPLKVLPSSNEVHEKMRNDRQHGDSDDVAVIFYFLNSSEKEYMMNKSGLIFGLLAGVAVLSTACTSTESTQSPATTQVAPTSTDAQRSSIVEPIQQGAAAQSDASMQQTQPAQATEAPYVIDESAN